MSIHYLKANQDYHNKEESLNTSENTLLSDTVHYYDTCHNDYLFAWCNRKNLALHYGYWNQQDGAYQHHQALLNMNQQLYSAATIQAHECILDAGCGLGGSSLWIAENKHNSTVGISLSEKQVYYAQQQAIRRQQTQSKFLCANFSETPFKAARFDIVWALESACYALDKTKFLQEAYRVLAPNGRIALCDAFVLQREFDDPQWKTVMNFLNGWAVPNLATRAEFIQKLEQVGFRDIQCIDISQSILPSSDYMYRTAKRLYPLEKLSRWLKLRSKVQTENYQVGFAQYDFFHQKLAEYCIFIARK